MKPYFEDADHWTKVQAVIDSWMGTPYRHLWVKKKRGADCSLWIGAVLQELGIVKEILFDFYPPDWFLHTNLEIVKDTFARNIASQMAEGFDLQLILPDAVEAGIPLMRGDIPGFALIPTTEVTHHAGILLDPPKTFVHSSVSRGVSLMSWGDYWLRHTTGIYRVVEV